MERAYSLWQIKALDEDDEDERKIEGIASTPTPDRVGDIVMPKGATFKNPVPLLRQHRQDQVVGKVKFGKATDEGIPFVATMPKIKEPGRLKDRVDEAWGEVKHGLVTAVSIGFRALQPYSESIQFNEETGGVIFHKTEIFELSLATIPAQPEAVIQAVKSLDPSASAASGKRTAEELEELTKKYGLVTAASGKKVHVVKLWDDARVRDHKPLVINTIHKETRR